MSSDVFDVTKWAALDWLSSPPLIPPTACDIGCWGEGVYEGDKEEVREGVGGER